VGYGIECGIVGYGWNMEIGQEKGNEYGRVRPICVCLRALKDLKARIVLNRPKIRNFG